MLDKFSKINFLLQFTFSLKFKIINCGQVQKYPNFRRIFDI